jgi:broad specificity phosphatase PhoE
MWPAFFATINPMGNLFLVRHGQASFGADDYDQLSALGKQQSIRLGEYWRERGMVFEAVLTGSLKRHRQTWEGIQQGLQDTQLQALVWPGLNEYDSEAVLHSIHPGPLAKPSTPELYKHHFGLLRKGLQDWMHGRTQPAGMPLFVDFVQGIKDALAHVRQHHTGDVLIVSSGGPIGTAVGSLLNTPPESMIELNMRMRNTAVSECVYNPKRTTLVSFNTLNHLDAAAYRDWVTFT